MSRVIQDFKKEHPPCELDTEEIKGFFPDQESDINPARSNKFILVIDLPNSFKNLKGNVNSSCSKLLNMQKLQMNVFGKVVPEIQMGSLEVKGWGQVPKVSSLSRDAYGSVNVQFTVDSKYQNYYLLYKWMDIMNDVKDGGYDSGKLTSGTGKVKDYSTTFTLYLLEDYNNPVVRWNYYGAFPISLGSIKLNKRDPEEIDSDFSFDFSFMEMELV